MIFRQGSDTAAHRKLPFGTKVKVTHEGRSVVVVIRDRGPFADPKRRCIDLSSSRFSQLASLRAGVIPVTIQVL